jgi:hypothetical protein
MVVFQSFDFGQILANFCGFGQFWADLAALQWLTACPKIT